MSPSDIQATGTIHRARTALRRHVCSRPIALALAEGLITKETSVFDYGCGHGADLRYLCAKHIRATGWDPNHRPRGRIARADVVNLGYVLNVIEDPQERAETLRRAYSLAGKLLIVSVRVERTLDGAAEFSDGVLTGIGTFQKIYGQAEFSQYVEDVLGRRAHVVSLGVAYVFADEATEADYVAKQAFSRRLEYRPELLALFAKDRLAQRYVAMANRLGRLPRPEEFSGYGKLVEAFGSAQRVVRLALSQVDHTTFLGSREQRRQDILTFLAMMRLQSIKPPPLHLLPHAIQADLREIWRSYQAAQQEGDAFLFSMGRPEQVRASAAQAQIGKLLPGHLYVHQSAEDELPALLRLILFAARQVVGRLSYDLAKIALDGQAVSFLLYDDFDGNPHPALVRSVRVFLPRASFEIREYGQQANPPILHRKDSFISRADPRYQLFRRLTEQEEAAGLLSQPDIGNLNRWNEVLSAQSVTIVGHELIRTTDPGP
jgi:DNA phosphorothioation-associated putative methyltransferase